MLRVPAGPSAAGPGGACLLPVLEAASAAIVGLGLHRLFEHSLGDRAPYLFVWPLLLLLVFRRGLPTAIAAGAIAALLRPALVWHEAADGTVILESAVFLCAAVVAASVLHLSLRPMRDDADPPDSAQAPGPAADGSRRMSPVPSSGEPADARDGARADDGGATIRRLQGAIAIALLVPLLLFGGLAWQARLTAIDAARDRLDRIVRVAQEHATRMFDTNAALVRQVEDLLGDDGDAALRERASELDRRLVRLTDEFDTLSAIFVFDTQGRSLLSSLPLPPGARIDASRREFFVAARDGSGWSVSEPTVSSVTGETFVALSRARRAPDGRFLGVISVSLRPERFSSFYETLARDEPGLVVSLLRADARLLARQPAPPSNVPGRVPDAHPVARLLRGDEPTSRYEARSPWDGRRRWGAFARVDRFPLGVTAALDGEAVLRRWTAESMIQGAFVLAATLALVVALRTALAHVRRERSALRAARAESQRRSRAERALLQSQKLEAIGQLTGGVAHDFNNLLTVVANNAFLLRMTRPDAASDARLAGIERAAAHGATLTRQLLAFSRQQALRPEVLRLSQRLPELVELLRATVGARVSVDPRVDDDVPPVRVDPAELELALINLALNARDAMPAGGHLALHARRDTIDGEPAVAISVRDTGAGIPAELRTRVFEPFFTTKPPGRGTGLGLSQVYGFALQAGGAVAIHCPAGGGTEVVLRLPASRDAAVATAPAARPVRTDPLHVLLVEDDGDVAASTHGVLERIGHRVTLAASGDAALAALAALAARDALPDVVVSDVVMPGATNGIDLALVLRDAYPALPVVLTTGFSPEVDRARAAGIEVIAKPCAPSVLGDAVARLAARAARAVPAA